MSSAAAPVTPASLVSPAPPTVPLPALAAQLTHHGYAVLDAAATAVLTATDDASRRAWAATWHELPPDGHLRDGGRYRRRRHASFIVDGERVTAAPHRAHYQPTDYNALHGGIERWFEPMDLRVAEAPAWHAFLRGLAGVATGIRPGVTRWFVEAHPFRIDCTDGIGRPTPEGAHRDGVDLVAVCLVARVGVRGGETRVFDAAGPTGVRFTLAEPWSLLLLDDARVIHETTPIQPLTPGATAHRDTLVVTLRQDGFQARQG